MARFRPQVRVVGLERAIRKLDQSAKQDMKVLEKELVLAARTAQREIAAEVADEFNITTAGAKKRIRYYKGKRKRRQDILVGVSLGKGADVVHAGRIKGVRTRKGRVTAVPGIPVKDAFLYRPKKYKGQKRRVYTRADAGIKSVNAPEHVLPIFEAYAKRRANALLMRALRNARRKNRGSFAQRFIGDVNASVR